MFFRFVNKCSFISFRVTIIFFLFTLFLPHTLMAISSDHQNLFGNGIYYFDPQNIGECIGNTGLEELDGHKLPATKGGVGLEEYFSDPNIYALIPPPAAQDEIDYYITMRWRYAKWAWNGTSTTGPESIDFYQKHPKVLVTNPANGKSIVAVAIEAGPAPWTGTAEGKDAPPAYWRSGNYINGTPDGYTGRVAGLPPKAFQALGAQQRMYGEVNDDDLLYSWAPDQNAEPGPTDTSVDLGNPACSQTSGSCGFSNLPIPQNATPGWYNFHAHGTSISYPTTTNGHNTIVHGSNTFEAESVKNSSTKLGEAVDIGLNPGTKVFAPFNGKVLYSGSIHPGGADGNMVILESANKECVAALAHLSNVGVAEGARVKSGERIGDIADINTDHLHFELWIGGKPINVGGPHAHSPFDQKAKEIWKLQKAFLTQGKLP